MNITANTNQTTKTNIKTNAKRRLGLASAIGGLTLLAGACGFGGPTIEEPAAPVTTPAIEVETEVATDRTAIGEAIEISIREDAKDSEGNDAPEFELGDIEAPEPAPEVPPTPAPVVDPVIDFCSDHQYPQTLDVQVVGTNGNGLRVRTAPGTDNDIVEVAPEGTILPIVFDADHSGGCLTVDGAVWWSVLAIDGLPGWAHSGFLAEFEFAGETDVPDFHGDESFDEEADAHADCVSLPSTGIDCLVVYRSGGFITFIENPENVSIELAQLDCVYNGFYGACEVLEYFGFTADSNHGLGNTLSQAPDEFLQQDCNDIANPAGILACAELDARL